MNKKPKNQVLIELGNTLKGRMNPDVEKRENEQSRAIVIGLTTTHHMRIHINGQIFTPYEGSPLAPCVYCNGELPKAEVALGRLGIRWMIAEGNPAKMLIQDAKNPLSRIEGFPCVMMIEYCPSCKGKHLVAAQLLM